MADHSLLFPFLLQSKQNHNGDNAAPFLPVQVAAQTESLKAEDDMSSLSSAGLNGFCLLSGSVPEPEVMLMPLDVILGRGQFHSSRIGNIRFHKIIELFMSQYNAATSKGEKSRVVQDIYVAVKESGRFVKMDTRNTYYVEVDEATGKEKIGQAIRYKQRKSVKGTRRSLNVSAMMAGANGNSFLLEAADTNRIRHLQDQIAASLASQQTSAHVCRNLLMAVAAGGNQQVCQPSGQAEQGETANTTPDYHSLLPLHVQQQLDQILAQYSVASCAPLPQETNFTPFAFETTWQEDSVPASEPMEVAHAPINGFVPTPSYSQQPSTSLEVKARHTVSLDDDDDDDHDDHEIISDDELFGVLGFPHEYEETTTY